MVAKIRKGDKVIVIAGKDKGKRGTVTKVITGKDKVIIENINMVKKHVKPNPQIQEPGGIMDQAAPIHVSNVAIFNAATGKADRVGFRIEDGKKVRVFKSGDVVDI